MQPKRMIRRPELVRKTGLSASTLYSLERAGDLPAHIMLTPKVAVWFEDEIDQWLESRRVRPAAGTKGPTSPAMARRAAEG